MPIGDIGPLDPARGTPAVLALAVRGNATLLSDTNPAGQAAGVEDCVAARAQTIDASARGAVCVSELAGTRARVGNAVQPGSHVSRVGESTSARGSALRRQ